MDAAFVPCTLPPFCTRLPPLPILPMCVQSPLLVNSNVFMPLALEKNCSKNCWLVAFVCHFVWRIFSATFCDFRVALFLFFVLALVAQIFFLVFCFGPTPFGKLMRKFLVKCEISRYFSKHTHSHTQEASECACVWWFFVCLQVGDYCTLFVWRCLSTKLLVHLSMPLDWWLLCALVQRPVPHPLHRAPCTLSSSVSCL